MDRGACPGLGVHADVPLVLLYYRVGHGQAQPARLLLRGEERVKDLWQELHRYAEAAVLYGRLHIPAGPQGQRRAFRDLDVLGAYLHYPSVRHRLHRVQDYVVKGLRQLALVRYDGPEAVGEGVVAADGRTPQHYVGGIPGYLLH